MSSNPLCQNDQFISKLTFCLSFLHCSKNHIPSIIIYYPFFCERLMRTDFSPLAVHESRAINNGNQTISTRRKEDSVFESS